MQSTYTANYATYDPLDLSIVRDSLTGEPVWNVQEKTVSFRLRIEEIPEGSDSLFISGLPEIDWEVISLLETAGGFSFDFLTFGATSWVNRGCRGSFIAQGDSVLLSYDWFNEVPEGNVRTVREHASIVARGVRE